MKNKIIVPWLIVLLVMAIFVPGILGYMDTHYLKKGNVVAVNGDTLIIEGGDGEQWEYVVGNGKGDEYANKPVKMYFCTNGTDYTIYDDSVERVTIAKQRR